jgi:hypothetical protein
MENKSKGINLFMRMLTMASGADIKASKEMQDRTLSALNLTGDEGYEYEAVAKIVSNVSSEKKVRILKATVANTLTTSELLEMMELVQEKIKERLDYARENPQLKASMSLNEVMDKITKGSDSDID